MKKKTRRGRTYDMRPVPTTWNGVDYKSRLEARWAIVFWLSNVPTTYEAVESHRGKDVYVPDFAVPRPKSPGDYSNFIEIKPTKPTTKEISALSTLWYQTGTPCWFFCGSYPQHSTIWRITESGKLELCYKDGPTETTLNTLIGRSRTRSPINLRNALHIAGYYKF